MRDRLLAVVVVSLGLVPCAGAQDLDLAALAERVARGDATRVQIAALPPDVRRALAVELSPFCGEGAGRVLRGTARWRENEARLGGEAATLHAADIDVRQHVLWIAAELPSPESEELALRVLEAMRDDQSSLDAAELLRARSPLPPALIARVDPLLDGNPWLAGVVAEVRALSPPVDLDRIRSVCARAPGTPYGSTNGIACRAALIHAGDANARRALVRDILGAAQRCVEDAARDLLSSAFTDIRYRLDRAAPLRELVGLLASSCRMRWSVDQPDGTVAVAENEVRDRFIDAAVVAWQLPVDFPLGVHHDARQRAVVRRLISRGFRGGRP